MRFCNFSLLAPRRRFCNRRSLGPASSFHTLCGRSSRSLICRTQRALHRRVGLLRPPFSRRLARLVRGFIRDARRSLCFRLRYQRLFPYLLRSAMP
jgi:hypothetical protein